MIEMVHVSYGLYGIAATAILTAIALTAKHILHIDTHLTKIEKCCLLVMLFVIASTAYYYFTI